MRCSPVRFRRDRTTAAPIDNVPYVVGIIEFDEQKGLRLPARVLDIAPQDVGVGMLINASD